MSTANYVPLRRSGVRFVRRIRDIAHRTNEGPKPSESELNLLDNQRVTRRLVGKLTTDRITFDREQRERQSMLKLLGLSLPRK